MNLVRRGVYSYRYKKIIMICALLFYVSIHIKVSYVKEPCVLINPDNLPNI